ncbi:major facilitator superfamily domain-containing protein [Schizophyllum amplum]|uniref:Major facilitator superfamily domain-containing protein n=1 Tax=Schizophyllum amplum TaxID=97359 RepID=A0A550C5T1_9AGAR|nr:major facilitator superfamily domain-containing protein [Auriculariopsis ampla]
MPGALLPTTVPLPPHDDTSSTATGTDVNNAEKALSLQRSASPASSLTLHVDPPQELSLSHLLLIHLGLVLALFLATTDANIVSTILPTLTTELGATEDEYTWITVAYLLTQTAFQPFYGQVSDVVGRKTLLFSAMAAFAVGSMLCGAAQGVKMLIAARAVAGAGGGGIVNSVWVINSDVVPVHARAKWSLALSVTWACSAVAGPLLGGVFSGSSASWRWAFFINGPVCAVSVAILALTLRRVPVLAKSPTTWRSLLATFDFPGLLLFICGTIGVLIGFSFAAPHGWTAPVTLVSITAGAVFLVVGAVYEAYFRRSNCLFPAVIFQQRTTASILLVTFLHNVAFNAGTFYLALYYQVVNGMTPLQAGVRMLPYSLGSSLASMPPTWFISAWQKRRQDTLPQNVVIWIGLGLATIGFGLMILLDESSSSMTQNFFPLIAGCGIGMNFHTPHQVFAAALGPEHLATATSAFFLVRFTGATIGLAVASAIFYGRLTDLLPPDVPVLRWDSSIDFSSLDGLAPDALREVSHDVAVAIRTIWVACTPAIGLALVVSFALRTLSTASDDKSVSAGDSSEGQAKTPA